MRKKLFLYLIFGILCTGINLGSQALVKTFLQEHDFLMKSIFGKAIGFWIQLITGTVAGFIVKFLLDKNFVFKDKHRNVRHTLTQFTKSSAMALVVTVIFWSTEIIFHSFIHLKNSELIGGVIGLAFAYIIKFFLDKRFVYTAVEFDTQPQ